MVKRILNVLFAITIQKNRTLCIFLPKMSAYRKDFDKTKCMFRLIKDKKLLEKYNLKFGEKSATSSKNNLRVNFCTMKNI